MEKGPEIIRAGWPTFAAATLKKMEAGALEYGDVSFDVSSGKLAAEIEQELLDVVGWGFILWNRIQNLKAKLAELEARSGSIAGPSTPTSTTESLTQPLPMPLRISTEPSSTMLESWAVKTR